ncbi:protein-methionine-sulfoxide reductase heme-binding subunit MsrQ [Plastorhodobacter daqingensis]|uniref:Protein-methionine-sulfoxide reductase heme-binding subunit MsrQ n=1 Tax=Plastorhodobacter daqingensis TaxID=1387281 RepID=A0ABW2URB2_9RHOB
MAIEGVNRGLRRVPVAVVWVAGLVPLLLLGLQAALDGLGVDPVKALERQLGKLALQFLVLGLLITPLRRLAGLDLLRFRRAIGLLAAGYAFLHLLVWLGLDMQFQVGQILRDIARRPYLVAGVISLVLLVPLAVTSTDRAMRRMGPLKWRRLHLLVYPAALLGAFHYMLLVKGRPPEPLIYAMVIVVLLVLRILRVWVRRPSRA